MSNFKNTLLFVLILLSISSCIDDASDNISVVEDEHESEEVSQSINSEEFKNSIEDALNANQTTHESEDDYIWNYNLKTIDLNESTIATSSETVLIDGTIATIVESGNYLINGSLNDGQIIVDCEDENTVRLIFNNAEIYCSSSAPVYIKNAEKTVIVLKEGTTNKLSDGITYTFENAEEDEPNATLFSKDDLSVTGTGTLHIEANYNDAICSKDGLIVNSGILNIEAVDDGIRGKDYLIINGGEISANCQGDGFKSDNEEDDTKGYIQIIDGTFDITAGADGIQAQSDILIYKGNFNITTGGGSNGYGSDTYKGLKSGVNLIIDNGTFNFNCADDAMHCNGSMIINDGDYTIASGDDGLHSDSVLVVNSGILNVTESYEGIESAIITFNGGEVTVNTSDDGINCAGGNDGSGGGFPGGPGGGARGQDGFASGDYYLYINAGLITVYAEGDGIDVNGSIEMTGGTVLVHGPTESMNGALDYDAGFEITGGTLIAAGSSGMAMAPDNTSSQNSLLCYFNTNKQAAHLFHIEDNEGNNLITFEPSKRYQSVAFSSPQLTTGETYTVYSGGNFSGTSANGWCRNGEYSGGSKFSSFKINNTITTIK